MCAGLHTTALHHLSHKLLPGSQNARSAQLPPHGLNVLSPLKWCPTCIQAGRLCKAAALHLVALRARKDAAELQSHGLQLLHPPGSTQGGIDNTGQPGRCMIEAGGSAGSKAVCAGQWRPPGKAQQQQLHVRCRLMQKVEELEDGAMKLEMKAGRKAQVSSMEGMYMEGGLCGRLLRWAVCLQPGVACWVPLLCVFRVEQWIQVAKLHAVIGREGLGRRGLRPS
eukprot:1147533-Pelagomonas_calceolata.AAC.15